MKNIFFEWKQVLEISERLIKINVNKNNLVPYEKNKWIIIINIIIIIKNTWFLKYATPENVTSIRKNRSLTVLQTLYYSLLI